MKRPFLPVALIDEFPDPGSGNFSREEWDAQFGNANVITRCTGDNINYPVHWGPLSVKCAFGGDEYYCKGRGKYAVSDNRFLLLNEGTQYSSHIQSNAPVESLTINFSDHYKRNVQNVVLEGLDRLIDDPFNSDSKGIFFEEKLYVNDAIFSRIINKLNYLCTDFENNIAEINESLYFLLEALMVNNASIVAEINAVSAAKASTRKEVYRKLNEARDYIDSCFYEDITLDHLAGVALMSPFHLLRQFKKNYHTTPHQYLMHRRLEFAKKNILRSDAAVTDICFQTGFKDMSSFSKLFKRQFGLSPLQFRNAHR